jgi:hypothetical protein
MGISAGDETAKYRTWAFPPATKRQNTVHGGFRRRRNGKISCICHFFTAKRQKSRALEIFFVKKAVKCRVFVIFL